MIVTLVFGDKKQYKLQNFGLSIGLILSPVKNFTLDSNDVRYLKLVYSKLLNIPDLSFLDVPQTVEKFDCVKIGNVVIGSAESRTTRNSYVLASWADKAGRIAGSADEAPIRSGAVNFYFRQRVKVKTCNPRAPEKIHIYMFYMARLNWYSEHPQKEAYGAHVQIWCNNFDSFGPGSFLPIQRINSQFAGVKVNHQREQVLLVETLPGY